VSFSQYITRLLGDSDLQRVPLRKIALPQDVARAMAFLASHRAAGHISGECLSVDGGMEGRIVWREPGKGHEESESRLRAPPTAIQNNNSQKIPPAMSRPRRLPIKIALSVDFDAVSGWLGRLQRLD
jgi:hypothetical protein